MGRRVRQLRRNEMHGGADGEGGVEVQHGQVECQRGVIGEPVVLLRVDLRDDPVDERDRVAMTDAHSLGDAG